MIKITEHKKGLKMEGFLSLNTAIEPSHFADIPVLHTFNVYDDKVQQNADMARLKASGINTVECSGSCKDCMVCYPKYGTDAAHCAIFELTKKAQGKTGGGKKHGMVLSV